MRFSHLKDKKNNLWATLAYTPANKDGRVAYGVAVVSVTEPKSRVSTFFGRQKAFYRCNAALEGKSSEWGDYIGIAPNVDRHPVYREIEERFAKLGTMPKEDFVSSIRSLRTTIQEK